MLKIGMVHILRQKCVTLGGYCSIFFPKCWNFRYKQPKKTQRYEPKELERLVLFSMLAH